ncbi:MAG: hypothetical protein DLM53_03430 [Candidatus Eremiobacter antarcticus]|nr:alpha/beta hydrolase [Candidatus Eremiobacteraeota bacterium]MBC5807323.1 alpha/beta hydrolase [Candidatus Eremiobacteraeota bacterium]PZR63081.1 MAG: hypothetical protein DLM53_03430 [Candidatus Eremiobacter sp. RRmetagenome_bin22]
MPHSARVSIVVAVTLCFLLTARASASCSSSARGTNVASIAYGEDLLFQALDLYAPRHVRGEPIVVFVHGGGWIQGDKAQYKALGRAFADCGIAFAAVNYRLAPAARVVEQSRDIAEAIRWLRTAADAYGYAPRRLFLMGHSAGAELAAYTVTDDESLRMAGLGKRSIAGVIAMDGASYDPTLDAKQNAGNEPWFERLAFGANVAQWKRYDISRRLQGDEPPFLIVHGLLDQVVSAAQPRQLVSALRAAGDDVAYLQPRADHSSVVSDMMTMPDDPILSAIARFVRSGSLQSI